MSQGTSSGEQRAHPKRVLDSEDARPGESSVWGVKRPRTGSANADTIAALAAGALAAQRADSQPAQLGLADGGDTIRPALPAVSMLCEGACHECSEVSYASHVPGCTQCSQVASWKQGPITQLLCGCLGPAQASGQSPKPRRSQTTARPFTCQVRRTWLQLRAQEPQCPRPGRLPST